MSSRVVEKQVRRERREAAERRAAAAALRARRARLLAVCGAVAVLVAGALMAVSLRAGQDPGAVSGAGAAVAMFAGLEQAGDRVGAPDAAVMVVEYGDLQCPACRMFARETVPALLGGLVASGRASFAYRQNPVLGGQSVGAAAAAVAAGYQGRLHEFVEVFYVNQGREHSGYADAAFLAGVAAAAGLDVARFERDRRAARTVAVVDAQREEALRLGFTGTPSLLVSGPAGKVKLPGAVSIAELAAAVDGVDGR